MRSIFSTGVQALLVAGLFLSGAWAGDPAQDKELRRKLKKAQAELRLLKAETKESKKLEEKVDEFIQSSDGKPLNRIVKRMWLTGEAKIRWDFGNYRHTAAAGTTTTGAAIANDSKQDSYFDQRTRLGIGFELAGNVDFHVTIQNNSVWGRAATANKFAHESSTGSDFGGGGTNPLLLHEAFIRFRKVMDRPITVTVGRQELVFGTGMLLGNDDFYQGINHEGIRVDYTTQDLEVSTFLVIIQEDALGSPGDRARGADAASVVDTGVAGGDGDGDAYMWGLYGTWKGIENIQAEGYYILVYDQDGIVQRGRTTYGAGGVVAADLNNGEHLNTIGTAIRGKGGPDNAIDYNAEIAYQFGRRQNTISAWATEIWAGYTLVSNDMKPRVGLKFAYASGDDLNTNANGLPVGKERTFDPLFQNQHGRYGNFDLFHLENLLTAGAQVSLKPRKDWSAGFNVFAYWVDDARDPFAPRAIALRPPEGNAQRRESQYAGTAVDLWASYQYNSWVSVGLNYSQLWGGEYLTQVTRGTAGSVRKDASRFYVNLLVKF